MRVSCQSRLPKSTGALTPAASNCFPPARTSWVSKGVCAANRASMA